eukprot:5666737-Heterocapsa_arctica.AAC.1
MIGVGKPLAIDHSSTMEFSGEVRPTPTEGHLSRRTPGCADRDGEFGSRKDTRSIPSAWCR